LTEYERVEILNYPCVYYMGPNDPSKKINGHSSNSHNFGYDDEKGDYKVINGDHIGFRYEIIDHLGSGSFG